ncbi:hypothetical protein CEXT_576211 [Caerostris extrusa]|uniref:Uncharacterized protein n=1 Tax=Caerostris extrusa TaxID=172846 RepID=A0AAV4QMB2_CAEEX|nr:hypothetical protein CEXT_576211 [Caerostris extrusa]
MYCSQDSICMQWDQDSICMQWDQDSICMQWDQDSICMQWDQDMGICMQCAQDSICMPKVVGCVEFSVCAMYRLSGTLYDAGTWCDLKGFAHFQNDTEQVNGTRLATFDGIIWIPPSNIESDLSSPDCTNYHSRFRDEFTVQSLGIRISSN